MILGDIASHHHIHGQADCSAIKRSDREDSQRPEWFQDGPHECGVSRQNVLDRFHQKFSSSQRHRHRKHRTLRLGFSFLQIPLRP